MDVDLALIVCFLMVSMTAVQSEIQRGPANALKRVGDSVTLKCVTVNTNCDRVDWQKVEGLQSPKLIYRSGAGMLNNDLYSTRRYSVNNTGGCSLTITQLETNDSGRFICMQAMDSGEETRSSILVVISVAKSCDSNVTSNALDKDDGYSLWCTINIPAKSVEPSNVTLSFHNKTVGETETTDENQPLTVKTTLTGTAKKENITRVCIASFLPNTQANYDTTFAFLDVCTTQQLIVSHPVESSTLSTPGSYYKSDTTDGHPSSTLNWTHSNSEDGVHNGTAGDARDKYTSTATNMVTDGVASPPTPIEGSSRPADRLYLQHCKLHNCSAWNSTRSKTKRDVVDNDPLVNVIVDGNTCTCTITEKLKGGIAAIVVSSTPPPEGCGPGCVTGAVIGPLAGGGLIGGAYAWHHSKKKKKNVTDENGEKTGAGQPLTNTTSSEPEKLPPNRPGSECNYAALQPAPNPYQMKPNPARNSFSVYASVSPA